MGYSLYKNVAILLTLTYLIISGCKEKDKNILLPPVDERSPFEINFLEYSDNHFFIDEVYADTSNELNLFYNYYGNILPTVLPKYQVKDIEVYKNVNAITQPHNSIRANAYINLPPRSETAMYDDSYRNDITNPIIGEEESSYFQRLDEGRDYTFHHETGYISFNFNIENNDIIAVAYRYENTTPADSDDIFYGEFMSELVNNSKTRGVLKLIKPRSLHPVFKTAWKLKIKNIYRLYPYSMSIKNLDLDIFLVKEDSTITNKINNKRLLELFGFDRFDETGNNEPDGKFDQRPGLNFNPRTGELIFPVLEPFGSNIPEELYNYKYQGIYDTLKSLLSLPGNYFIIKGKADPI